MRKTFKYRLYPNKTTEKKLYFVLNRCRELYNAALSERKDAYRMAGKSITYFDQQNDLPAIKHVIRPEYEDIAAHVLQDVLNRLHKAFQNFFRRCKNGENPGYPRFQGSSSDAVRMERTLAIPDFRVVRATTASPIQTEPVGSSMEHTCTSLRLARSESNCIASSKARSRQLLSNEE